MKNGSLVLLTFLVLAALPAGAQDNASCAAPAATVAAASPEQSTELVREGDLRDEELDLVVDFMVKRIAATGENSFTREEIHNETGIVVTTSDGPLLQAEVFLRLEDQGSDDLAGNRCSDYGACSLYGDLSGATGELLTRYEQEKTEDGKVYDGEELPTFIAHRLDGSEVSSLSLDGEPTVLAFLAVHCTHSLDSLPILNRLTEEVGLNVVGVYINSGTHEDVASWLPEMEPKFDVWVRNDDELGDLFSGHLVPAYFFVSSSGEIKKKLVGFQDEAKVLAELESPAATIVAGAGGGR